MNIKLCLIAPLLSLAVVNAYAGDITINVPIELVNAAGGEQNHRH